MAVALFGNAGKKTRQYRSQSRIWITGTFYEVRPLIIRFIPAIWVEWLPNNLEPLKHIYIDMRDYCLQSGKVLYLILLMHQNLFTSKIDCQYPINAVSPEGNFI